MNVSKKTHEDHVIALLRESDYALLDIVEQFIMQERQRRKHKLTKTQHVVPDLKELYIEIKVYKEFLGQALQARKAGYLIPGLKPAKQNPRQVEFFDVLLHPFVASVVSQNGQLVGASYIFCEVQGEVYGL